MSRSLGDVVAASSGPRSACGRHQLITGCQSCPEALVRKGLYKLYSVATAGLLVRYRGVPGFKLQVQLDRSVQIQVSPLAVL